VCKRIRNGGGGNSNRSGHMPTRNRDSLVGSKDTRSGFGSGFDLVAQPGVEAAKSSDGPDCCDTAKQLILCKSDYHLIGDCTGKRRTHDGMDQLLVITLLFLWLSASGKVNVHIDQTRKNIVPVKINNFVIMKIRGIWYNVFNFAILDQNTEVCLWRHVSGTVQNNSVCKCVIHNLFPDSLK